MNILYLGKFFPQNLLKTVQEDSKGKIGFSNHNFEISVLNGLRQQKNINLRCISIPGVFSFPYNNRKIFTKAERYSYKGVQIYSVGFCNLAIIKELWALISCALLIIKIAIQFKDKTINVIINTPDNRLLNALRLAKLFCNKHFTQTVIIPDIPSMVTAMDRNNFIKAFFLGRRDRNVLKYTAKSDGVVLLTEAMMDFISKPIKHIVMEGIVDIETMDEKYVGEISSDHEIILYTGTLRKIFGVMNLVNAFRMIPDPNAELWICGSGDAKKDIENASKQDTRIKFWGLVDSKAALEMQRKATILINPRTSEGLFTRYSFPSKTMEYLLAGKSVIINRLPGIPEEYYKYVYTPPNEDVKSLSDCIVSVLNRDMEQRKKQAFEGRKFIIEQKNSVVQMARVLKLIQSY
ncbi:MAG: glycosyltransferase family 4 protein [Bacteroidales bacterium]|nr:glycosyltransferase family 4 protein [Bacteroidales bacterium]